MRLKGTEGEARQRKDRAEEEEEEAKETVYACAMYMVT
jgi:hypothetical protein